MFLAGAVTGDRTVNIRAVCGRSHTFVGHVLKDADHGIAIEAAAALPHLELANVKLQLGTTKGGHFRSWGPQ